MNPCGFGLAVPKNIAFCKLADADNPAYPQVSTYPDASVAIQLHAKAYLLFLQLKGATLAPLSLINHSSQVGET
jgi:hypothetical protein